jgi:hypothetical protein
VTTYRKKRKDWVADTSTSYTSSDVLVEVESGKKKIGDSTNKWADLAYLEWDVAAGVQPRSGSTTDWANLGVTLSAGELGYNTTTGDMKIGDGSTAFSSLRTIKADGKVVLQVTAGPTNTATGDAQAVYKIPARYNGLNLTGVAAWVGTTGTTGTTDIQVRNITDSQDMLSTKMTIDSTERSTLTAATPAVINTSYDDVATDDFIAIDVDAVHSGTPAKGLWVELTFG